MKKKSFIGALLVLGIIAGGVYLYRTSNLSETDLQGAFKPCSVGNCLIISSTGPSAGTYSAGQSDFELFDLAFENKSTYSIDINQLVFNLNATGGGLLDSSSNANYSNIKLVDSTSGAILAGPVSLNPTGSDSTQTVTFIGMIPVGSRSTLGVTLMMDVGSGVVTGDTLSTNLRVQNLRATWVGPLTFILTRQVSPQSGVASSTQTAL